MTLKESKQLQCIKAKSYISSATRVAQALNYYPFIRPRQNYYRRDVRLKYTSQQAMFQKTKPSCSKSSSENPKILSKHVEGRNFPLLINPNHGRRLQEDSTDQKFPLSVVRPHRLRHGLHLRSVQPECRADSVVFSRHRESRKWRKRRTTAETVMR